MNTDTADIKTKFLARIEQVRAYLTKNRIYVSIALLLLALIIVSVFVILIFLPKAKNNAGYPYNGNGSSTSNIPLATGSSPTPTRTPTPTPHPLVQGPQTYSISMKGIPSMYEAWFNTIDPKGGTQTVKLKVRDNLGAINSVTAVVKTDKLSKNYNLVFSDGTTSDGGWTSSWSLNDTYDKNFAITFSAVDDKGNKSSVDLTIR